MSPVAQLARLNEIDLQVDATKARLAEIAEALKEPAELRSARAALREAETILATWQARQRDAESAQAHAADKLAQVQQQLYSGRVTNPKELESREADMAQSRRQLARSEDELLEALIGLEAASDRVAADRQQVAGLAADYEASKVTLREEQVRLTRRLATEQARQAAARAAAPQRLLPTYDLLRARKGGKAVAALDGDTCSACRVAVSPTLVEAARESDEPVYCENCGRILWGE